MVQLTMRVSKPGRKVDYIVCSFEDHKCLDEIYTLARLCGAVWVIATVQDSPYKEGYAFEADGKTGPITYA